MVLREFHDGGRINKNLEQKLIAKRETYQLIPLLTPLKSRRTFPLYSGLGNCVTQKTNGRWAEISTRYGHSLGVTWSWNSTILPWPCWLTVQVYYVHYDLCTGVFCTLWPRKRCLLPGARLPEGAALPVDELTAELIHLLLHPPHLGIEPVIRIYCNLQPLLKFPN